MKYISLEVLTSFTTKLAAKLSTLYVRKESGKSLSTNDYTTTEKNKLAGLNNFVHPTTSGNKHIPSGGSSGQVLGWSSDGTATWVPDKNNTYTDMKGATASATGTAGLVPAPAAGKQTMFLRGDGTWVTPENGVEEATDAEIDSIISGAF